MRAKRILVPIDFSDPSRNALREADQIAAQQDAELLAVVRRVAGALALVREVRGRTAVVREVGLDELGRIAPHRAHALRIVDPVQAERSGVGDQGAEDGVVHGEQANS